MADGIGIPSSVKIVGHNVYNVTSSENFKEKSALNEEIVKEKILFPVFTG
jgi:hypothetical protein